VVDIIIIIIIIYHPQVPASVSSSTHTTTTTTTIQRSIKNNMASSDGMNGRGNDFDDAYNTDAFIDNGDSTLNAATQAEAAATEAAAAAVRDDVYCHLTARRAVARAALYLGTIDYMSVEALDTLAGVLCSYLSRIGQTLAACTEASGRSSSHVHVLDCLRAVELCTEAAVQRVHFEGLSSGSPGSGGVSSATTDATNLTGADASAMEDAAAAAGGGGSGAAGAAGGGDSSARRSSQHARIDPVDQTSWKGLAAFCFGPNWHEPLAATTAAVDTAQNGAVGDLLGGSSHHGGGSVARRRGSLSNSMHSASGGGGKVGPSSLSMAGTNSEMMLGLPHQQRGQQPQGWDAPYPEDICAWPVVSSSQPYTETANPHAMSPFTVDSLHNHTTTTTANATMAEEAQQLYEIPDVAFLAPRSGWGRLEPGGGTTETGEITLSTTATVATSAADAADAATDSTTAAAAAGKRKQEDEDDSDSMPAKKKTKFSNDDNDNKEKKAQPTMAGGDDNAGGKGDKKTQLTATGLDDHNRRPFYVPRHFPPFPRPADAVGRTVLDDDTLSLGAVLQQQQEQEQQASRKKKKEASSTKAATARGGGAKAGAQKTTTGPMVKVRSALVRLGTPWGSGWDRDPTATAAAAAATSDSLGNTNALPNGNRNTEDISAADDDANHDVDSKTDANKISVPVGRTTEPPRDNNNNNNNDASGGGGGGPAQIVPLNRASGSRVSRILEGSMDAAPVM
jgi:hypothetical protein